MRRFKLKVELRAKFADRWGTSGLGNTAMSKVAEFVVEPFDSCCCSTVVSH